MVFWRKKGGRSMQPTNVPGMMRVDGPVVSVTEKHGGKTVLVFNCPHCGRKVRRDLGSLSAECECGTETFFGRPPGVTG